AGLGRVGRRQQVGAVQGNRPAAGRPRPLAEGDLHLHLHGQGGPQLSRKRRKRRGGPTAEKQWGRLAYLVTKPTASRLGCHRLRNMLDIDPIISSVVRLFARPHGSDRSSVTCRPYNGRTSRRLRDVYWSQTDPGLPAVSLAAQRWSSRA